jgi:hypothetical protein
MITTPQEYYAKLHLIQDTNKPTIAVLAPGDEKIYNIDLETRKMETPTFLSVEKDHLAETIYFTVDRYYDGIDLSETTCIVQYINANKEARIYAVPFFDITTHEGKILFPWCIEGEATKAAGTVQYSFKFYHTFKGEKDEVLFDFNLNTIPTSSKVLTGLDVAKKDETYDYIASEIEAALARVDIATKLDIEWIHL